MSNGVFNFNFLTLVFSKILGGSQIHTRGLRHLDAPYRRNIFTQSEYFTISNCVFNFNILALVVSEILGGSKIYIRGPCAPLYGPQRKNFCTRGEYFIMSNGVFNFNFLALVFSEILEGSQISLGGPTPPGHPYRRIFLPKASTVKPRIEAPGFYWYNSL